MFESVSLSSVSSSSSEEEKRKSQKFLLLFDEELLFLSDSSVEFPEFVETGISLGLIKIPPTATPRHNASAAAPAQAVPIRSFLRVPFATEGEGLLISFLFSSVSIVFLLPLVLLSYPKLHLVHRR